MKIKKEEYQRLKKELEGAKEQLDYIEEKHEVSQRSVISLKSECTYLKSQLKIDKAKIYYLEFIRTNILKSKGLINKYIIKEFIKIEDSLREKKLFRDISEYHKNMRDIAKTLNDKASVKSYEIPNPLEDQKDSIDECPPQKKGGIEEIHIVNIEDI